MDLIFYLVSASGWAQGEKWDMPHSLWYEGQNGYLYGILLALVIAFLLCLFYFRILPKLAKSVQLKIGNWMFFMFLSGIITFVITFLFAKKEIVNFALDNDYFTDSGQFQEILNTGTLDMWMYATECGVLCCLFYFLLSFLLRIRTKGMHLPFSAKTNKQRISQNR